MLATRHSSSGNFIECINNTNLTRFRARLLTPEEKTKIERILGLEQDASSLGLCVDGYCEIAPEDVISVMGEDYIVNATKSSRNEKLAGFRKDYDSFDGKTEILLQRG